MDSERTNYMGEGVPLNSPGAANIFLNTGKNSTKVNSHDGTVIHLNTGKPSDLGVHINTTFAISSSKKIKLLFVLNFLLSVICMAISCSIAFYYWNEMMSMRRQMDTMKDHFIMNSLSQDREAPRALTERPRAADPREPRTRSFKEDTPQNARKYYVEDLGEDMLLVDLKKKNSSRDNAPVYGLSVLQKESVVAHFNGAYRELNLKNQSFIGPWIRDEDASTKNSEDTIEMHDLYFTVKQDGLYLVYAQVVYLTQLPSCYFIWASQPKQDPRLLSTCSTGDDSSRRWPDKRQISCGVQTVARLHKGDNINFAQREENRTVWLRKGYSYFGFVKLSS